MVGKWARDRRKWGWGRVVRRLRGRLRVRVRGEGGKLGGGGGRVGVAEGEGGVIGGCAGEDWGDWDGE